MLSISHSRRLRRCALSVVMLIVLLAVFMTGSLPAAHADEWFPVNPAPYSSPDGTIAYNVIPPLVVIADPDPAMQGILQPLDPELAAAAADPGAAAAAFSITYKAAGTTDPWGASCQTFPDAAKTAFNAAAAIWSATIQSSVPIAISACWSNLGSPYILGYSGTPEVFRDFPGAPKANTWYVGSLANALSGTDQDPAEFDDYITYNSGFSWYFGTDGLPPAGQYDLVSVAAHEIAHGLNFSGSASYSGGTGSYGYSGYPEIYDTFMEDGGGTKLTAYANPSAALGSLLTSGNLWFNGTNANAANAGTRVKMYAPGTWSGGSSYSHLDYTTFAGGANSMMVYAIGSGSAQHNPGPVTKGLLQDLGWVLNSGGGTVPTPQAPSGTINDTTPTYKWSKVTGATQYRYELWKGTTKVYTKTGPATACGASSCTNTPTNVLTFAAYKWRVQAYSSGAWSTYSAYKNFTISSVPIPKSPSGTITDTTPTFTWTRVSGATQYQFVVSKGTVVQYTKTVASGTCGSNATTCSNTPTNVLSAGNYTWKVKAYVGGAWKNFSANKAFTIGSSKPKAGFWESTTGDEFYVTPDQNNVDNFAIFIYVNGCGNYKITYTPLVPIVNKHFSFNTGSFYGNGTFNTTTSESGQDGLSSFYLYGCGTVSGGPWSYTAVWKNTSQPVVAGKIINLVEVLDMPETVLPSPYHVIEVVQP